MRVPSVNYGRSSPTPQNRTKRWHGNIACFGRPSTDSTESINDAGDSDESDCSSGPSTAASSPELGPMTPQEALEHLDLNQSMFLPESSISCMPMITTARALIPTRNRALTGIFSPSNPWYEYIVTELQDSIPEMYLGVPPLEDPSTLRHRVHRIVVPCQAPSIMGGEEEDSFHLTAHPGYSFKLPSDMEHNNKDMIKSLTKFSKKAAKVTGVIAGLVPNSPSLPVDSAVSGLSSFGRTAENRARLMNVGISPDELYRPQRIVNSEKASMKEMLLYAANADGLTNITGDLQGLLLHDGRTVWVCHDCLKCLRQGKNLREDNLTLAEYKSLTKKETELAVTLTNLESLIIFTETLKTFKKVQELILEIKSGYFEAPDMVERHRTCLTSRFDALGKAIRRQKSLTHLRISGDSLQGEEIYGGLQSALLSYSLKSLHISGIHCLFEDRNLPMRGRYLRNLRRIELDHVRVNTTRAGDNLRKLIKRELEVLVVKRAEISSHSAAHIFMDEKKLRKPFKKFKRLVLSDNDLVTDDVTKLLEVVLMRKSPKLDILDISRNPRINPQADRRRIEITLRDHNCRAELAA
ncbi:hypothetical protein B0O80DRAFT_495148 [Mortierella sp. GBAus27b]|nr:hypothetical protein BGX31_004252 [Mortierella sp. GBA43]KAI8359636.1 hypothetical protein B0O80DRAFT_495148 [Mortierella sp. GBAus27b]